MRRIFLIISLLSFLLTGVENCFAQPNTLYFLPGIPQTRELNPARSGAEKGTYFSMPFLSGVDFSFNTNNWSYNDLIHKGSGAMADSLVWDYKNFLSSLGRNNFLNQSASVTILDFGWKRQTDFVGFSWSEHEFVDIFFTKELANMLINGNQQYLGNTFQSGYFGGSAQHYRQFAITYAKELPSGINVGITGKLLFGLSAIKTSGLNAVAGMPSSGDQIDLAAAGKTYISAPVDVQFINKDGYRVIGRNYFSLGNYLNNFGNPGFSLDFGVSGKVNKKLEVSASLIDLGFIYWHQDITTFTEEGHYLFRGIFLDAPSNKPPTTNNLNAIYNSLRDSIRAAFTPAKGTTSFTSVLPVKIYLAGEYEVDQNLKLGGLARIRIFNNMVHTSLTASANAVLSEKLNVSASYSLMESTFDNLGLAATYRIRNVQLYAASDNVLAFNRPPAARNLNLRFGINFLFPDDPNFIRGMYIGKVRPR
ncbi:MAG: DUF5723 family protein [Prolixibacteraceae bacterium]